MKPYAILSDLHLHNWSAFSKTLDTGVNSRLQIILDEIRRAAAEVEDAGGNTLFFAGDTFHVRGSVDPTVLNPTLEVFESLIKSGFKMAMIPGNHDLGSKESDGISNAAAALARVGVEMIDKPDGQIFGHDKVFMIPWHSSCEALLEMIKSRIEILKVARIDHSQYSLIIHAPVNGVIMGIPDHGLDAKTLGDLGFKRVFAGHYHNHVDFGNGVYSVGATTHQTWSDPGTKAGFLIVDQDKVRWHSSHAPAFIDVTAETDPEELPLLVSGNYVRVKLECENESEVASLRNDLTAMGALGVVVHPIVKSKEITRTSGSAKIGTLAASISAFVKDKLKADAERAERIDKLCQKILTESEVVA